MSKKLYLTLQKKYKGELAAMYAEADAEAQRLNTKARTLKQVKKQMAYSKIESMLKDTIVIKFMRTSGYNYDSEDINTANYCWKKEGADNGSNSNN